MDERNDRIEDRLADFVQASVLGLGVLTFYPALFVLPFLLIAALVKYLFVRS